MPANTVGRELLPIMGNSPNKDLAAQPLSACLWWGLPVAIGAGAMLLRLPFRAESAICSALFLWMAVGCLLNARRCRRVHCFISGPVLLVGAIFAAFTALGFIGLSARVFTNAVSVILVLALLSIILELVWRRYA